MTYSYLIRIMLFSFSLIFFQGVIYGNLNYYLSDGGFYLNVPDHVFYSGLIGFSDIELSASSLNNFVIVYLYSFVSSFFNIDIIFASALINLSVLVFAYARIEKLCFLITGNFLPFVYCLGFFLVLPFSVLINKDSFGVLFYILLVSFLIYRGGVDFFLLLLLFPLRLQFPLVFLFALLIFTVRFGKLEKRYCVVIMVLCLYFFGSGISLYAEYTQIFFLKSGYAEGGVAYWASFFNSNYYIGSFIFNLLKPLQYVYDLYRGAVFDYQLISAFIYFIKIYVFIVFCSSSVIFFRSVYSPWFFLSSRESLAVSSVICSFFLVYIISPIVDFRYFMNIAPVFMLLFSVRYYEVK